MKFIFEVLFIVVIIVFSDIQANLIADNKPVNHTTWAMAFAALIGGAWALERYDYWFMGALVLEHFVFFSPFLNFFRRPRKPFFYISSVGIKGSLWDKLFIKIQPAYPYIWIGALISFALINIFKL